MMAPTQVSTRPLRLRSELFHTLVRVEHVARRGIGAHLLLGAVLFQIWVGFLPSPGPPLSELFLSCSPSTSVETEVRSVGADSRSVGALSLWASEVPE